MLPDRVSNPGPLTYESGALPIALCDPATVLENHKINMVAQKVYRQKIFQVVKDHIHYNCQINLSSSILETSRGLKQISDAFTYRLFQHCFNPMHSE